MGRLDKFSEFKIASVPLWVESLNMLSTLATRCATRTSLTQVSKPVWGQYRSYVKSGRQDLLCAKRALTLLDLDTTNLVIQYGM